MTSESTLKGDGCTCNVTATGGGGGKGDQSINGQEECTSCRQCFHTYISTPGESHGSASDLRQHVTASQIAYRRPISPRADLDDDRGPEDHYRIVHDATQEEGGGRRAQYHLEDAVVSVVGGR